MLTGRLECDIIEMNKEMGKDGWCKKYPNKQAVDYSIYYFILRL